MAKRAKPGDVVMVSTSAGPVYVHYLGRHRVYGDGVTVCPTKQVGTVLPSLDLFQDGYFTFFPVGVAVARGLASIIGHLPSSGIPTRLRRAGRRSGNKVETWIIEDGAAEVVRKKLTDAELRLPIASIWNLEALAQAVSEGWRPEMEGDRE